MDSVDTAILLGLAGGVLSAHIGGLLGGILVIAVCYLCSYIEEQKHNQRD